MGEGPAAAASATPAAAAAAAVGTADSFLHNTSNEA